MSAMRILYYISEYHRFNGAQRSLLELVRKIPREGIDPIVAFGGEGRCTEAYRAVGVEVRVVAAPPEIDRFGQDLLRLSAAAKLRYLVRHALPYSRSVLALAREVGASVLHCNTSRSLLLGAPAAVLGRLPRVWHVRGQLGGIGSAERLACEVMASKIILVAETLRNEIRSPFRDKCRTVHNGIAEDSLPQRSEVPATIPTGAQNGRLVVATFAAVTPFKGYHHLIRAAKLVNEAAGENRPTFLAVGEPFDQAYGAYLEGLVAEQGLDNVHFVGWQPNPRPFYDRADVVVLPTIDRERLNIGGRYRDVLCGEGFPRTILEAMFLGKPVVATRVAGASEQVVDGETGFLVSPRDPRALANAILRLVGASAEQRRRMGEQAAIRARTYFSSEIMVRKTTAVYRELVEPAPPHPR